MTTIVKVICASNGQSTAHDGRYVVSWNPHTPYGICAIDTTAEKRKAHLFNGPADAFTQWKTVSQKEPRRPDGEPNRPLTGLTIELENFDVQIRSAGSF